jgi:hypothetical protein
MFTKRIMIISVLLIVAIGALSCVSAGDVNATDQLAADDGIEVTQNNELSTNDNVITDPTEKTVAGPLGNATLTPTNLEGGYKTGIATVKVTDLNNNPLAGQNVKLKIVGTISYSASNKSDENGIATFNFKDLKYYENIDGNLTPYDLTVGKYPIKLDLNSNNYTAKTVSDTLTVKKTYANIDVNSLNVQYGSNETFTISLSDSATGRPIAQEYLRIRLVNVAEDYFLYLTDAQGKVQIKVDRFSPGKYQFNVAVANEDNIQAYSKTANVVINEPIKKLTVVGTTKKFKNSGQIILKVKDKSTGKFISGIKLKIKVFTGKKYKTFNLVTKKSKKISNAIGVLLKTNKFSVGTHKVTVKITSPNYTGSGTFKLTIPKTAQKYKKFTYVVSNGKGKYV